jgi:hypothetical protein
MTEAELQAILARNPQISLDDTNTSCRKVPPSQPQRRTPDALDCVEAGKASSLGTPRVSFVFYRTRLLDVDGFRGGEKDLLDGLVKAGILPGDEVGKIELDPAKQTKVYHKRDERTEIEILLP